MRRRKFTVRTYRDANRPHLNYVVNHREDGKRKRSFFETKEEATAFAGKKNIKLQNEGSEGVEFPSWLRIMAQDAIKKLKGFEGATITAAVNHYVQHLQASEKSCTAAELVAEILQAKKKDGRSKRHLDDLNCRLNIFAEKFNGNIVATITTKEIDDWLRSLDVSPVTRNHYRRLLVLAFNFAVEREYAKANPAKKTAKAKENDEPPGILTIEQTTGLLENASPGLLPYLAIGAFAGLRRAELERLDWKEVDFESDLIEVTAKKAKTARRRHVTMQPNLREWLLPLRKPKGNITAGENFRQAFDQARKAAGIVDWPDNALRHSFASYHLAHFKDAKSLALQMGHTNEDLIFSNYRQLVKPKEAERYWNIRPAMTEKIVPMLGRSEMKEFLRTAEVISIVPNTTRARANLR